LPPLWTVFAHFSQIRYACESASKPGAVHTLPRAPARNTCNDGGITIPPLPSREQVDK